MTIMAGLLVKEPMARNDLERCLVVAAARRTAGVSAAHRPDTPKRATLGLDSGQERQNKNCWWRAAAGADAGLIGYPGE